MLKLTPEWFKDKSVTVMGLGVHGGGLGSAAWLLKRGAQVTVTDLRDESTLAKPIAALKRLGARSAHPPRFVIGRHDEGDFTRADMVIRNPAVPRGNKFITAAEKAGVPIESDTSIFFSLCPFPIAAVSGTKGKTTTTTLLAEICRAHDERTVVGGNIRISQLAALDKLLAIATCGTKSGHVNVAGNGLKAPPIVLELSSWQLESLEARRLGPHVAVLTNVKEDHLNRYDGMDDYARAKELIYAFQKPADFAIVNADDARVAAMGRLASGAKIGGATHAGLRLWYSMRPLPKDAQGCFVRSGQIRLRLSSINEGREVILFPVTAIKLPGIHNVGNVLAACLAAVAYGMPLPVIRRVTKDFHGVPHRLETVRVLRGIRYVNDTTATAPDASIAALETFGAARPPVGSAADGKRIVLIAGGADKDLTFGPWAKAVKKRVKHLVLIGGTADAKIDAALAVAGVQVPAIKHKSMREALADAREHSKRGDIILLSPGCASFGAFLNEFDRGEQFVNLVKRLK